MQWCTPPIPCCKEMVPSTRRYSMANPAHGHSFMVRCARCCGPALPAAACTVAAATCTHRYHTRSPKHMFADHAQLGVGLGGVCKWRSRTWHPSLSLTCSTHRFHLHPESWRHSQRGTHYTIEYIRGVGSPGRQHWQWVSMDCAWEANAHRCTSP